jgi:hypothetical protein
MLADVATVHAGGIYYVRDKKHKTESTFNNHTGLIPYITCVMFIVFLSKLDPAELYCVADVSEKYSASILSLEVFMKVVRSFGMWFVVPTAGVDKLKMEIFHNCLFNLMLQLMCSCVTHTSVISNYCRKVIFLLLHVSATHCSHHQEASNIIMT